MSTRFHDLHPSLLERVTVKRAEIAKFATLKDADVVLTALNELVMDDPASLVFSFASGAYFVVLITPEVIGDTDVKNTNS